MNIRENAIRLACGSGAALLSFSLLNSGVYRLLNSSVDFCQSQEKAQVTNDLFKLALTGLSLSYTGRLIESWPNRNISNWTWDDVKRSAIALSIIGLAAYGAASSSEYISAICGESSLKKYFFGCFTYLTVMALWYRNPINDYLFFDPMTERPHRD